MISEFYHYIIPICNVLSRIYTKKISIYIRLCKIFVTIGT